MWKPPTSAQLQRMGLTASDIDVPAVEIWPEHALAWACFASNSTQWRAGGGGPFALDYNPIYQWLEDAGITGKERQKVMGELRHIEAGALEGMRESADNEKN